MNELTFEDFSNRKPLGLFKRFFASILDKLIICFLFFLPLGAVVSEVTDRDINTYLGLILGLKPGKDGFMPNGSSTFDTDMTFTILFIIINILYYYSTEVLFKASLGKRVFRGVYIDSDGNEIVTDTVVARSIILTSMMGGAVVLHWVFDLKYLTVIFLFFLVNDSPVLFTKRSFIDIKSNVFLVKRLVKRKKPKARKSILFFIGSCIGKCIYSYRQGLKSEIDGKK